MDFIQNAWYAAAWSDEVGPDQWVHRRILGEDVLLYRTAQGTPVALADRCPHRFVPLHLGRRHGDTIQCAYHGLRFDASGACVLAPCGDTIPKAARVRAYPVIEQHRLIYLWTGAPADADAQALPDFWFMDDPHWAHVKGYLHNPYDYQLMIDNILDLTHTQFLHEDSLGSPALAKVKTTVVDHPQHLELQRWMPNERQGPLTATARGFADRPADTWLDTRWYPPGLMEIEMGMVEPGAPRSQGKVSHSLHLVTPETATSHHYFWSSARGYAVDDAGLSERLAKGLEHAFRTEDKPILEAQQQAMGGADFWSLQPVLLGSDAGGVRARRRLDALLQQQAARAAP